jgi:proline iminopeptidase
MREEAFRVPVAGGALQAYVAGEGPPALVLHGGPAVTDYMGGLVGELDGLARTIRYQQRGTPPSAACEPYTIEAHVADALTILDFFQIERAWAIGHSWGGHLAMHVAVTHPDRLTGLVCLGTLGISTDVFAEQDAALRRGLSAEAIARIEEVEERRRCGEATEQELLERFSLIWPQWFSDPARAAPNPVVHIGPACSTQTNASISEHFRLLERQLPSVRLPTLFVHGELDALPVRSSLRAAALVHGAEIAIVPGCGHFLWLECPGQVRRRVETFLAKH